jgi:signal transduction histidine kinase
VLVREGDRELAVLHLRDVRAREAARRAYLDAEHEAAEAEKAGSVIQAVDQYMSHVSHELKTPLAVILSSSSMLERYYLRLSDTKREEHFSRIQAQVRYLTEFLDNLRFLSHLESGQIAVRRDEFDAAELLQEMVNSYAGHQQEPLFDVQTSGAVGKLYIDGALWRRIMLHLLSNAVKYGPRGGTVHISVARRDAMLEARISDHGPGLPAELRPVTFDVFQRGSNSYETQGGGLGLAITARCVSLLGGTISYETATDAGTTFTVLVPVE